MSLIQRLKKSYCRTHKSKFTEEEKGSIKLFKRELQEWINQENTKDFPILSDNESAVIKYMDLKHIAYYPHCTDEGRYVYYVSAETWINWVQIDPFVYDVEAKEQRRLVQQESRDRTPAIFKLDKTL